MILLLNDLHNVGYIEHLETFDESHDLDDIEQPSIFTNRQELERDNWDEIFPELALQVSH